jgi:hypothetical protein
VKHLIFATVGLLISVVALSIVPGSTASVRGQDVIQVLSDEFEVNYPSSVDFSLSVSSDSSDIASIRLLWQAGPGDSFTARSVNFRPSQTVTVSSGLNTQFLRLPPFSQITYRWQIRDQTGNELTTENRTIEYEDYTNDWQEIENEYIRLLWYDLDKAVVSDLFGVADEAYHRLARDFGVELDRRPIVLIYPDQHSFMDVQRFMNNVEFVIGRYFPGHNITINLVAPDMDRDLYVDTIAHELSHLYSDNFYVGYSRIPLWLEEGLATFNEDADIEPELQQVTQAAEGGNLVPFIYLGNAIRDDNIQVANLAYAEGATVFQFIRERWGQENIVEFLSAFRRTTNVGDVTTALFGLNLAEFEMAWREWLGFPVESVPQLVPTPTLRPFMFATPTYAPPGG